MAGIKISDLPPNTLPLVGDELMELEDSNGDSTRATVADIASSASGLDATFVTITANAALPNERVLTEGTNITIVDNGPGNTVVISAAGISFPLLAPDGSAAAPSYSFTNDPGAGMFLNALGELSFAADGVEIARAINGTENQFAVALSGNSSVPDLTSLADLDTGFRWDGSNETIWIGGGSRAWNFSTVKFYSQFSNGPGLFNRVAERDVPTLVPDHADDNTGVGGNGSDEVTLIAGGIEGVRVDETGGAIQVIIDPGLTNTSDATPPLAFGGGTVGFRSPDSDQIFAILSGTSLWHFTTTDFHANITDGPALRLVNPSDTVPSLLPNQNDIDTGIGTPTPNGLSFITGALEALELQESGGQVLQINLPETGIIASTTQTQGERPLISSYNEIASVANPDDVVTAPAVRPGMRLIIVNNGANDLQVFPASGDNIGAGVDGSITIAVGDSATFLGEDFTEWMTLYNGPSTPSVTIPDPLLLTSGSSGAPSYSFTVDPDTGVFNSGADLLGFTAGGVEIARADGVASQFLVVSGGNAAPGYSFLSDPDMGMYREDTDRLAFAAGGVPAVMYQEGFGTGILAASQNDIGLTASATQTQAGGLVLRSSYNEVATVATTGDALTLQGPPTLASVTGKHTVVVNNGANDLQLFPAVGDDLGAGVDASITVVAGGVCILLGRDGTNWDVLYNDVSSPGTSFPLLAPDGSAGAPAYSFVNESRSGLWRAGSGDLNLESFDGNLELHALNRNIATVDDTGIFGAFVSPTFYLVGDVAATATDPVYAFNNDNDTGIGQNAADQVSIIGGGVEIARAVEGVDDQFVILPASATIGTAAVPALQLGSAAIGFNTAFSQLRIVIGGVDTWRATGTEFGATATTTGPGLCNAGFVSLTIPGLCPIADNIDTGVGSSSNNNIAVIVDNRTSVLWSEATGRIVQTNEEEVGLTASVTQTQAGGFLLRSSWNEIATVANNGDALTAFACAVGTRLTVINNGANELQLFPAVGDNFGAGVDVAITVDAGHVAVFIGRDATNWDTLFNSNPNIEFPGGATVSGVWKFDSTTTEADPGSGTFRNDNATIASVTEVFISGTTETGFDANNILALVGNGDQLYIQNKEDATQFMLFDVTANVDNTGWFSIAGTVANSNANFTDGAEFGVLILFGGTGAPSIPVFNDAVQARRTTDYLLTTAFVDITLDTTDIETDSAVLDHDLATNTDNIIAGVSGTYRIHYAVKADPTVTSNRNAVLNARVRLNDGGTGIAGSVNSTGYFNDSSIDGEAVPNHLDVTFYADLSATDFITLQLSKTEISGSDTDNANEIVFTAERIL